MPSVAPPPSRKRRKAANEPDPRAGADGSVEFHLHEYALMGELQLDLTRWGHGNFALSLLSSGAILSWTLLNQSHIKSSSLGLVVAFLPFLITGTFGLTSLLGYQRLQLIGSYMAEIEQRLSFPDLGWHRRIRATKAFTRFRNFVAVAWLTLLAVDLLAATLLILDGSR